MCFRRGVRSRAEPLSGAVLVNVRMVGRSFEGIRRAAAEAGGWASVGIVNLAYVGVLSSRAHVEAQGWVVSAAVDFGHFALLAIAAAAIEVSRASLIGVSRLRGWAWAVGLALAVALAGHWLIRDDVANLVERWSIPDFIPVAASAGLLFAATYFVFGKALAAARRRIRVVVRFSAPLALSTLLVLVAANNLWLPPDYPAANFFVAACAARVGTFGLEAVRASRVGTPVWSAGTLVVCSLSAMLGVAYGVSPGALRPLLGVPGSVTAPFLARFVISETVADGTWIQQQHPEWLRDRSQDQPIPPIGKPLLRKKPVVIFLTIDALRADVVASGKHDALLPELARLRNESVWFRTARSPSPSTLTTLTSVFSGKYYSQLYWTKRGNSVLPTEDDSTRWPALLSAAGVRTIHATALRGLSARNGVGVGFSVELKTKKDYARAREVANLLIEEIDKLGRKPAFLFAHFVDPHAPYNLGGTRGSSFERYLAEVALVDRELGRLRTAIQRNGHDRRTVFMVSADHGEAFGEHGMNFHARSVYDELLRVPLLIRVPGLEPRAVDEPVTLLDVGPTILDLFRIPTPGDNMGQTLLPLLTGNAFSPRRPIAADSGRRIQALFFPNGMKAIRDLTHNTREVYDLTSDPGELRDLSASAEDSVERYSAGIQVFFETHTLKRPGWTPPWRKF